MKRTGWFAVIAILAAMLPVQAAAQNSQGVTPSSRVDFGTLCGIKDTSPQIAMRFVRSGEKWVAAEKRTGIDNMAARVWHQSNWMVDLHDSPAAQPSVVHTGQLCFDPQGNINRMIDRYMEMEQCQCMRFTSVTFAPDGKETKREVHYVNAISGEEIAEPEPAKKLPGTWQFRRLDELPFYALLKK